MNKGRFIQRGLIAFMKFTFLQLAIAITITAVAFAGTTNGQGILDKKVSLKGNNESVRTILRKIEKQLSVRFTYNSALLRSERITVGTDSISLGSALGQLFGLPIRFEVIENDIIVIPDLAPAAGQLIISGKVTDELNQPLPGVNVVEKGTTNGTTTGADGDYKISVSAPDAVLMFSFIGYTPQEVAANGRTTIDLQLNPDIQSLQEVVVIGYGTQEKKDITGAVASVNSGSIAKAATPDPTGALQGRVPGVTIVRNTGKPGNSYSINIRGTSSLGGSNAPLYVIDGIPISITPGASDRNPLNDLNPADIERIDVLKDASATAIYGSRGAKGVVIVTTKRGKSGKTSISYDGYIGARVPVNLPDFFSPQQYAAYRKDLYAFTNNANHNLRPEEQANLDAGKSHDWVDDVLKTGLQQSHNVSVSGGDDKTQFSFSAGTLKEEGNVAPEDFARYSARGSIDRKIDDKWKAGLNLYVSHSTQNLGSSESLRSAYRVSPLMEPTYNADGKRIFNQSGITATIPDPVFDQENDISKRRGSRVFGDVYLQLQPLEGLTLKSTISPNMTSTRQGQFFSSESKNGAGTTGGAEAYLFTSEEFSWVLDNQITYQKDYGDHGFTATVVQSLQKDRFENNSTRARGFLAGYEPLWYNLGASTNVIAPVISSAFIQSSLASFSGRINYDYKDRYLFTATGRYDGSSRLAEGNKWAFFPSAAVAWRISDEPFMANNGIVEDLKLRVSYGVTGNDRVPPYSSQALLTTVPYDFNGTTAMGYAPNQLANKNLTWEKTNEVNVGLDFGLLAGRISGSLEMYDRRVNDVLMSRALPPPAGYGSIQDNIGKLRNRGIEIGLNTVNIQVGKFTWKTDFVFDANRNSILKLSTPGDDIANRWFIGQPIEVNYDYAFDGIWQLDQADQASALGITFANYNTQIAGNIRVKDVNGRDANGNLTGAPDGRITTDDRTIIGKRIPNWTGSFATTFQYGNLDLYVMAYTRQGEQYGGGFYSTFLNYTGELNQVDVDYWTPQNPSNTYPRPGNVGPYSSILGYSDVSFVRISNITLGYTLPASVLDRLKLSKLRVYATAVNPILFTDYKGFDPEWPTQNTYGTTPGAASYLFGVNLSL